MERELNVQQNINKKYLSAVIEVNVCIEVSDAER